MIRILCIYSVYVTEYKVQKKSTWFRQLNVKKYETRNNITTAILFK